MNSGLKRLLALLLLTIAVLMATTYASASEAQWLEIRSPHFSVVTDAGEKRGREAAMRFEQMRSVFAKLMTKINVTIPVPLQIVAFRNGKELRQIAPLWNGKPIQLAGLFQGSSDRTFIMLDMSVESPWTVVFHEYAHQLMNGVLTAQVDPWFEEGFAEYFSSIEVDNQEARVGKIPEYEYEVLQHEGMMKIADLFRVRQNSSTYNENGNRRTVFYAESGIVVHYLYDNNLIPKLSSYFSLKIDKSVPVEDAIQQSFGMSATEFDKALRNYASSGRYKYYALPTPSDIVSRDYQMRPMSLADSNAVIADIHLHSPDYRKQGETEFQQILKSEPGNAAACRGLGYAYLQDGKVTEAAEYFRRAAQADSKDPRVHYYFALLMNRNTAFANKSDIDEMVKELDTAIALDPSFADAYTIRAFARLRAGDKVGALADGQKAVILNPRNENYRFNMAQMYLASERVDEAMVVLKMLQTSGDLEAARRAHELLAQTEQFKTALEEARAAQAAAASGTTRVENASASETNVTAPPSGVTVKFLKGSIASVDCSAAPAATLTVTSGAKTWKMQVADSKHVLVLGADGFSCSWSKQKVALNYQEIGDAAGSVVSIEIQ